MPGKRKLDAIIGVSPKNNKKVTRPQPATVPLRSCEDGKETLLHKLPNEVLVMIFNYLSVLDLANITLVDEQWDQLLKYVKITLTISSDVEESSLLPEKALQLLDSPKFRRLIYKVNVGYLSEEYLGAVMLAIRKCKNVREFGMEWTPITDYGDKRRVTATVKSFAKTLHTFYSDIAIYDMLITSRKLGPPCVWFAGLKEFINTSDNNAEEIKNILSWCKDTLKTVKINLTGDYLINDILGALAEANLKKLSIKSAEIFPNDLMRPFQSLDTFEYKLNTCYPEIMAISEVRPYITKLRIDHYYHVHVCCNSINAIDFARGALKCYKNLPNVTKLSFFFNNPVMVTNWIDITNAIEIASQFKRLKALKIDCKWDVDELDSFLLGFLMIPTLNEVVFSAEILHRSGVEKGIEVARNLRALGYRASFVKKHRPTTKYYLIVPRNDQLRKISSRLKYKP